MCVYNVLNVPDAVDANQLNYTAHKFRPFVLDNTYMVYYILQINIDIIFSLALILDFCVIEIKIIINERIGTIVSWLHYQL